MDTTFALKQLLNLKGMLQAEDPGSRECTVCIPVNNILAII
jgi:hypothetical protein